MKYWSSRTVRRSPLTITFHSAWAFPRSTTRIAGIRQRERSIVVETFNDFLRDLRPYMRLYSEPRCHGDIRGWKRTQISPPWLKEKKRTKADGKVRWHLYSDEENRSWTLLDMTKRKFQKSEGMGLVPMDRYWLSFSHGMAVFIIAKSPDDAGDQFGVTNWVLMTILKPKFNCI
jgi:hypothetical protein